MTLIDSISSFFSPAIKWEITAKSITGEVRAHNEDFVLFGEDANGSIAILADGVGGHNAGEVASRFVCYELLGWFDNRAPDKSLDAAGKSLKAAIESIHNSLYQQSHENERQQGMATTLAMVLQFQRQAIFAWAGDSRIYLARNNTIEQISADHSFVEEKFREGLFSKEDAEQHPMGNIITSCLGANENMPHLGLETITLKIDDQLILVSDGVSDVLSEDQIAALLPSGTDAILDASQEACSNDNCSVVIVKVI
jgi:PPM family protein phosphatase